MTNMIKMMALGGGFAALAAATPATAQYYPYYGYNNNVTAVAAQRCQAAVQNRLSYRTNTGILGALLALVVAFTVTPLAAQTNWPNKPVRLVVGFTPGSATDVTGRVFADKFSQAWGQPVIVDNVPGNSGAIGCCVEMLATRAMCIV